MTDCCSSLIFSTNIPSTANAHHPKQHSIKYIYAADIRQFVRAILLRFTISSMLFCAISQLNGIKWNFYEFSFSHTENIGTGTIRVVFLRRFNVLCSMKVSLFLWKCFLCACENVALHGNVSEKITIKEP